MKEVVVKTRVGGITEADSVGDTVDVVEQDDVVSRFASSMVAVPK